MAIVAVLLLPIYEYDVLRMHVLMLICKRREEKRRESELTSSELSKQVGRLASLATLAQEI